MIYLDAGATTLQKPPMVAYHMQSALRRINQLVDTPESSSAA